MDFDETIPDTASMSDEELKETIDRLTDEEREVSYRRRVLHGQIDILRAELVNRLKAKREGGETLLSGADVQQLTDILLGKVEHPGGVRGAGGPDGRPLPRVRVRQPRGRELLPEVRGVPRPAGGRRRADDDDLQGRRDRRVHRRSTSTRRSTRSAPPW